MPEKTLRIRQADRGDTRFLAWVIQEAARSHLEWGVMDMAIPDDEQRWAYLDAALHADARSFFHHTNFLVAEIDGRHVAALSGYEPKIAVPEMLPMCQEVAQKIGWSNADLEKMLASFGAAAAAFPDSPEERWTIEWVATLPEFRGRGIVHKLMVEILDRGRERGYEKAQIGYLLGNRPARRAYESQGFKTVYERRDAGFEAALGCEGMACMHMDL
jgi:translation initiation factor 4G